MSSDIYGAYDGSNLLCDISQEQLDKLMQEIAQVRSEKNSLEVENQEHLNAIDNHKQEKAALEQRNRDLEGDYFVT